MFLIHFLRFLQSPLRSVFNSSHFAPFLRSPSVFFPRRLPPVFAFLHSLPLRFPDCLSLLFFQHFSCFFKIQCFCALLRPSVVSSSLLSLLFFFSTFIPIFDFIFSPTNSPAFSFAPLRFYLCFHLVCPVLFLFLCGFFHFLSTFSLLFPLSLFPSSISFTSYLSSLAFFHVRTILKRQRQHPPQPTTPKGTHMGLLGDGGDGGEGASKSRGKE